MIAYVDSSALVKLVIEEAETKALRATLPRFQALVSSELALVEVARASRRVHGDRSSRTIADVFRAVSLLRLDRPVVDSAGMQAPTEVRTLDALHLAAAHEVTADVLIAYDQRLLAAAEAAGLSVASPR
ncbi:MAG: uncharacterized protein QOC98_2149 [Frankiaceae bacterium]|nr:uncharacterized protein [Frankiaceae bacterium]